MAKRNQLTTSDYLEYSEYQRLVESLRKDKEYVWELYARLAFCTACRVSDVLNLKWSDVLDASQFTVLEKKTGKSRKLIFNNSVKKKIREVYELLGSPDKGGYIFLSKATGKPITVQYVNQKLKVLKCKYRLSIDNFSTHTFRKTFGRYVYETNNHSAESLILLNKILNHTSLSVTKTYIGITQDEINNVFNSIAF